jgi:hypothetical protein
MEFLNILKTDESLKGSEKILPFERKKEADE